MVLQALPRDERPDGQADAALPPLPRGVGRGGGARARPGVGEHARARRGAARLDARGRRALALHRQDRGGRRGREHREDVPLDAALLRGALHRARRRRRRRALRGRRPVLHAAHRGRARRAGHRRVEGGEPPLVPVGRVALDGVAGHRRVERARLGDQAAPAAEGGCRLRRGRLRQAVGGARRGARAGRGRALGRHAAQLRDGGLPRAVDGHEVRRGLRARAARRAARGEDGARAGDHGRDAGRARQAAEDQGQAVALGVALRGDGRAREGAPGLAGGLPAEGARRSAAGRLLRRRRRVLEAVGRVGLVLGPARRARPAEGHVVPHAAAHARDVASPAGRRPEDGHGAARPREGDHDARALRARAAWARRGGGAGVRRGRVDGGGHAESWRESLDRARRAASEWVAEESAVEPEPVYRYWVELDCTPSTWEAICEFIRSQPTANRNYRFHPTRRDER